MAEYIDEAYVAAVAADYGLSFTATGSDADAAIKRARVVLDAMRWEGQKANARSQREEWPRTQVYDRDGFYVDSSTVPPEIKDANALLAVVEAANPGVLSPEVNPNELLKQVTAGSVTIVYRDSPSAPVSARPVITRVRDILKPLSARANPLEMMRG